MEDIANVDIPEVKVTPEMIEAGVAVYPAFDSRYESRYNEAVVEIFEAMWRARTGAAGASKTRIPEVG